MQRVKKLGSQIPRPYLLFMRIFYFLNPVAKESCFRDILSVILLELFEGIKLSISLFGDSLRSLDKQKEPFSL